MFPDTNPNLVQTEAPREREEMFPMQEQGTFTAQSLAKGMVYTEAAKPAAVVFAERIAEAVAGAASPAFVP